MTIQQRKKDHVALTLEEDVSYRKGTGFEQYDFNHNALPEVDLDEVETSSTLFGRRFAFPLFISSMTGGYTEGGAINGMIATFCQKHNLPFGVGSQRIMLERASERASFSVVREHAPDAFIAANIGDRKSTRLNSSHVAISYAVFCLKNKYSRCHYVV